MYFNMVFCCHPCPLRHQATLIDAIEGMSSFGGSSGAAGPAGPTGAGAARGNSAGARAGDGEGLVRLFRSSSCFWRSVSSARRKGRDG